jgi:hypothetical protein
MKTTFERRYQKSSQKLESLFDECSALEMDDLSHKICLVSRENRDDVTSLPILKPITPNMYSKLACQIRKLERQVRMYKRFAKTRDSRAVACIAFEAAGNSHHPRIRHIPNSLLPRMGPASKVLNFGISTCASPVSVSFNQISQSFN